MELTLYFAPGASSMAPHIALHEIGAPFEARPISFAKHEQRSPAYLALNPEGKVPVLLVDGRVMTEVAAILYFLARLRPDAGLWPAGDVEAEAQVISWMSFIASTIHPSRRSGAEKWAEAFALAERRLAGREWAIGAYSIADIHLFRLFWRYVRHMTPAAGGPEARQHKTGTFPGLEAHHARMMARPAVTRTLAVESAIGYELPS
jgi:glutathione S-transferase